jgi:hypothetical protein
MTPESRNSSLLCNGSVNTYPRERTRATIREKCFLCSAPHSLLGTGEVNQHATIEEAVFSVGAVPRLYNEDLRQLELELRESPELVVGRIIVKKWQERNSAVQRRLHSVIQLQWDCYESVARTRLVETEDTSVGNSELDSVETVIAL